MNKLTNKKILYININECKNALHHMLNNDEEDFDRDKEPGRNWFSLLLFQCRIYAFLRSRWSRIEMGNPNGVMHA